MPAFFAGVAAIVLYAVTCYAALVYVVEPLWPFLVVGGVVAGTLMVSVVVTATLLRLGPLAAPTVTPADVPRRLPRIRSAHGRDDAWPNFLFAQATTDLQYAAGHVAAIVVGVWMVMGRFVRDHLLALAFWPLLLLPLLAAVAGTAASVAAAVVFGVVLGAVLLVARLGWLGVVGLLRGADLGVRVLRRAKATCPDGRCTHRTRLPAYRCACDTVHHDIRAGRQGLFARLCVCGRRLPTTVLQAAAGLVAVCQDCGRDLHEGAGTLTDVVIPVFGSTSAGKTRLIYAGMVDLARHVEASGGGFRPDGAESEAVFRAASDVVEQDIQTAKTAAGRPPAGVTIRLRSAGRAALLHLFDAAGEAFTDRDQAADLRFLDDPQGLVFVLDPFSVPEVAVALRGALASTLAAAEPAHLDPEQSYLVTAQWLRDQGVALDRRPLAVAVVKADLLLGLPPAAGLGPASTSDEIERWLRDKGLDNLLDGAQRDFGEVRYHLVASRAADGSTGPTSPAHPLVWLLRKSGVAIREPTVVDAA